MDTLVQGGKYQVLEVLEEQDGYRACLCIDIETNNHYRPMIFNIYERDTEIRRFLPAFFSLNQQQVSDFIHVMSGRHSITAVFDYHDGIRLDSFFQQTDKQDFELRTGFACKLLEECLILDAVEDFIAASCLEPGNIVVSAKSREVGINYVIRPGADIRDGYKGEKLAALMELIFVKDRYVPDELWEYIAELGQNRYRNIIAAFSRWKELQEELLELHKKYRKETLAAYLRRKVKQYLKTKRKNRWRVRG